MSNDDKLMELTSLLGLDREEAVAEMLEAMAVQDIAGALAELEADRRARLFALLPEERQTDAFSYLPRGLQFDFLDQLPTPDARRILGQMLPDDRTSLLESAPPEKLEEMLGLLQADDLKLSLELLGYPEESAGRLMTTRFVAVRPDWSVARALDHIRHEAHRGETVHTVFVTDERGRLLDEIRLRDLILARQDAAVASIMDEEVVSIEASADREQAVETIQHYDINTLPVTDRQGTLLGIVTVDDVMDVAQQEATEDFHKFGGAGAVSISLRDATPGLLYRKRIGWLIILVFVNLVSGLAIALFENAIETVIALVFFLPLIIASGGNAGSQSATLMVRALATGDVQMKDWFHLWGKELAVAILLGLTMAAAVSLVGVWRGGLDLAMVVALAMVAVVIMGAMIGVLLPFILQRFNFDPATASTPLITSVADVLGILIYFSIAAALLDVSVPAVN